MMSTTEKITKTCPYCGKDFTTANSSQVYCSSTCQKKVHYKSKSQKEIKQCLQCGKEFIATRISQIYCSQKCSAKGSHKLSGLIEKIKTCPQCGKEFTISRNGQIYCSSTCKFKSFYNPINQIVGQIKTCPQCGKEFTVSHHNQKHCSASCRIKHGYKNNSMRKNIYEELKKKNLCPKCGKKTGINPKTDRYYTFCDTCRVKRKEYTIRPEVKEKLKKTYEKYKLKKKEERAEYHSEYRLKNKETKTSVNPRLSPKTCTCGTTFLGGPTAKYCQNCRAERIRQHDREKHQRKKAGAIRSLGSTDLCAICGKPYTVNAGLQKYCPECSVAEDKRRQNESWQRGYYGNPEKRRQMIERARQWAENNKGRLSEILRKNYEKTKETRNENRRKRTGYKLRPLGRTETCPKCQKPFTVTNRNQKYCGDHSRP